MPKLPVETPIDFLVKRKFGRTEWEAIFMSPTSGTTFEQRERFEEFNQRVQAYREELASKPPNDMHALYLAEKAKHRDEQIAQTRREEDDRFFNKPSAAADIEHWTKCAHWTLDEAVALSFGKAPEIVNWNSHKSSIQISTFAAEYARRRDLALRAAAWKQLYDPVLPTIFLAWALRLKLEVPELLVQKVEEFAGAIADWKDLYDKQREVIETLRTGMTDLEETVSTSRQAVAKQNELIQTLQQQRDDLAAELARRPTGAWPWGERRTELLTHMAAAADRFWKLYDPSDSSTAPRSADVENWLIQRSVPKRVAEVIAQILRADDLPVGRRS